MALSSITLKNGSTKSPGMPKISRAPCAFSPSSSAVASVVFVTRPSTWARRGDEQCRTPRRQQFQTRLAHCAERLGQVSKETGDHQENCSPDEPCAQSAHSDILGRATVEDDREG